MPLRVNGMPTKSLATFLYLKKETFGFISANINIKGLWYCVAPYE